MSEQESTTTTTTPTPTTTTTTMAEAEAAETAAQLSALRANIVEKGTYSYYYGHALDTPEVRREREVALRLQKEAEKGGAVQPLKTEVRVARPRQPIAQFSWSDGKKRVTIYIPTDALNIPEENYEGNFVLDHTPTSMELEVTDVNKLKHIFQVPRLYDEISAAKYKFAPEKKRITVHLTKKSKFTWANLRRAK